MLLAGSGFLVLLGVHEALRVGGASTAVVKGGLDHFLTESYWLTDWGGTGYTPGTKEELLLQFLGVLIPYCVYCNVYTVCLREGVSARGVLKTIVDPLRTPSSCDQNNGCYSRFGVPIVTVYEQR